VTELATMAAALAAMAAELATIWQQKAGHNLAADSRPQWQQKACHDGSRKLAIMADSGRKPVAMVASLS